MPAESPNQQLAFEKAAQIGDLDTVARLLPEVDPRANNFRALHDDVERGHGEVVRLLLPFSDLQESRSVLLEAAQEGHADIVSLVLPLCDPKFDNSVALRRAAYYGHADVVRLLIPVSVPKVIDSLALRVSSLHGHTDTVRLLIPVSDPKIFSSHALRNAISSGHKEVADLLIPVSDPGEAFLYAVKFSNWGVADVLSEYFDDDLAKAALIDAPVSEMPQTRARFNVIKLTETLASNANVVVHASRPARARL